MGTTSSTSLFTGSSAYSKDFQNVIDRAVAIASLPIQVLTNQQTALNEQSTALAGLDTKLSALQSAVSAIEDALSGSAFQTEVSNEAVVSASLASGATEGVYSIKVNKIGSYATSLSTAAWDSSGDPKTYTLLIGNKDYTITPADNSAATIAATINAKYGDLVRATAVNVVPGDTRISLQSTTLDPTTLDLFQIPSSYTPTGLQQQSAAGYAVSQSGKTWDSSGEPATYTLVAGGTSYSISPAGNTADQVAAAINSQHGDQVQATVVDLGTGTSHDYRIRLEAVAEGVQTLDLQKAPGASLQIQQNAATSRTTATWDGGDAPAGNRFVYTLAIGGTKYSFTPTDNSAATVASTINSLYGTKVHATVIDLGTGGAHDYRISLQNRTAGTPPALDLLKTTAASLQTQKTAGALAEYEVNGSGVVATSNTRSASVADGVTLNLLSSSTSPVDVTVTRSTSVLSAALSSFADAYNAAADEIAKQHGESAGALRGDSILASVSRALRDISTYNAADGQFNALTSLGLELMKDGHIRYNSFQLAAADFTNSAGVTSFLGSANGGWLKAATDALNGLQDPTRGLLQSTETNLHAQIARLGKTIAEKQTKVDALQIQMQNRLAAADALLASMEQQYSFMSAMFSAQDTARKMYSA